MVLKAITAPLMQGGFVMPKFNNQCVMPSGTAHFLYPNYPAGGYPADLQPQTERYKNYVERKEHEEHLRNHEELRRRNSRG